MCFVCGPKNDSSTKTVYFECENDAGDKVLISMSTPLEIHQSYPQRMHGGVVSALLDEAIGRAYRIHDKNALAVTIDLNVKFRKPTPIDQTLYTESKVTNIEHRFFEGEGKLFTKDGTICATATAKYFFVPLEKAFPDAKENDKNWYVIEGETPKFIDI